MLTPSKFLVYGLIDPRSGELRYVGKSCSGMERPRQHTSPATLKNDRGRKANWVRQLLRLDLKPEVEVLEVCESPEGLNEAERHHIAYWRFLGANLTNLTAGGDGMQAPAAEVRRRMSSAQRRRFEDPAERARVARAHLGTKRSGETRKKMSESAVKGWEKRRARQAKVV